MKGFLLKRNISKEQRIKLITAFSEDGQYLADNLQGALPAISLVSQSSLAYSFINDVAPDMVFAQQVYGYGWPGDVLIGLSTSGNSKNVVNAVKVAKAFGLKTKGIMKANYIITPGWIALFGVAIVIVSYITSMLITYRIRKISAYALVSE